MTPMTVPLWLVLTLLGLVLTVLIAFIPYVIFQSKQMFTLNKSFEVLFDHVKESRTQNGRVLDYQTKMTGKTEQYDGQVKNVEENSKAILLSQAKQEMVWEQIKETLGDLKKIITNNTAAMTDIKIALNNSS